MKNLSGRNSTRLERVIGKVRIPRVLFSKPVRDSLADLVDLDPLVILVPVLGRTIFKLIQEIRFEDLEL
jgi:hypothetical protein